MPEDEPTFEYELARETGGQVAGQSDKSEIRVL